MVQKSVDNFADALRRVLKEERVSRELSHDKLADKAGISRQAVSKIEAGIRNPTMITVYKLVKAMDMTMEEFVSKLKDKD